MITNTIVLVPGIGLGGAELLYLAWQLRRSGYQARIFWTNPWRGDLAAKASALHRLLTQNEIETPSFVAHSFGGPIVLRFMHDYPNFKVGRSVMLGSPLTGCIAARRVMRIPGGRWIVSEALASTASEPDLSITAGCETGSIAGRANVLLGLFLCPRQPNDTIICVEETKHPGLTAHCVLFVSHTGMLVSRQVSERVVRFLRTGRFAAPMSAD